MTNALADVATVGARVIAEVEQAIVGKRPLLAQILAAVLADGHVLLEDYPGLAKTLIAKSFAAALGLEFRRIQFTPDLLPGDITGSYVYDRAQSRFELRKGPIFANIILADEINRASPKTQSALLEAMQEGQVTLEGETMPLPEPFVVIATQNPIEYEGTFPLPEAQLDRFLFKVLVDYAPQDVEIEVLRRYHHGFDARHLEAIDLRRTVTPETLAHCKEEIRGVQVDEGIFKYITDIAQSSRKTLDLLLGGSPRASISLLLASKAWAAMQGRAFVVPDDVKFLVRPVYRHRVILKPEAEIEGLNADTAMTRILARVEVPR
jgi:MoxR-like ATPase